MSERFPLATHAVPGREQPAAGACAITLCERRPGSIVEVALWGERGGGKGKAHQAVARAVGVKGLPAPGRALAAPGHLLLSTAPGRYLAIGQGEGLGGRLEEAVAGAGAAVDLTHGRAGLRVSGEPAAALLQKGLSLDLDLAAFPPMAAASAGLHHMGVTLVRLDAETFDLFVGTSLAGSLWDWASDAAVEYGWRVTAPSV